MTLAAVWMVSRAVDQVAQEAQSEARQANGLRVSWKLRQPGGYKGKLPRPIRCLQSAQNLQSQ